MISIWHWLILAIVGSAIYFVFVAIRRAQTTRPQPAQLNPTSSPPARSSRSGNYFVRHWRGELPLVTSYWINGFLASIVVLATALLIREYASQSSNNFASAAALIAFWAIALAITIWQVVGTWRSASNHIAVTGRKFWAGAAMLMIVLGVIRTVGDFLGEGLPSITESLNQARWLDANAKWEIRILKDGTELELSGGIGHGFADDVQKFLKAAPAVRTVHVNLGSGGLIDEAKRAAAMIQGRNLATYTSATCVSACTIVFLGGRERALRTDAKIGFHAPMQPGGDLDALLAQEEQYLVSIGISREFARRALRVPSDQMWYPSESELISSGVVTSITDGSELALSGMGSATSTMTLGSLDAELQKTRIYKALKVREPETYQRILLASFDALKTGKSMDQLREMTIPEIHAVYLRNISYSSDAAILRFTRLMIEQMKALQSKSPRACLQYINGGSAKEMGAIYALVPKALQTEELDVMAEIIETASPSRKIPTDKQISASLQRALTESATQIGSDLSALSSLQDPLVDPAKACRASISLYQSIVSLSPNDSVPILRNMFK